jgi:hypothetical protein
MLQQLNQHAQAQLTKSIHFTKLYRRIYRILPQHPHALLLPPPPLTPRCMCIACMHVFASSALSYFEKSTPAQASFLTGFALNQ